MSALPQNFGSQQPPDQPVRHFQWKHVIAWTAGVTGFVIALVIVAVIVLLHSNSVHQYVLRTAQDKATAALGSQVHVGNYELRISGISPTIDLYDVIVHGANSYPNPPLLTVDRVHAEVRVTSILRRTWYLNDATVEHPVIRVLTDKNGIDNLPKSRKNSTSSSNTNLFDLGVRHARLDRGEVYYNNQKSSINADLQDLQFQSGFNVNLKEYAGTLGYRDGHLQIGDFRPMQHNLSAEFSANPQRFTLKRANLSSGPSHVVLTATVDDYSQPRLRATYDATLDAGDFRRIMRNATLPSGIIRMAGSLQYAAQSNVSMMQAIDLSGTLSSRVLRIAMPSFKGSIDNISARYNLNHGNLDVRDIRAHLLGGELTGTLRMTDVTGASRSQLRAALRGISLAEAKSLINAPSMRQVSVAGTVNADADARWGKTFDDLVVTSNADINGSVGPASRTGAFPVNGVVHARYSGPSKTIALSNTYVRTPQTLLTVNGTMSDRSALQLRLEANDLHELETVSNLFRTPAPGRQPLGLYGASSFAGNLSGSTKAPHLVGQLNTTNLRVKGSSWKLLRTAVNVSPSLVSLQNGQLTPATRGRIAFNLSAALRNWSFTETSPINVKLNASQLNVADLAKAAGTQAPISGTLSADIALHGSQLNPIGNGNVTLVNAVVAQQPIRSVTVRFRGTGNEVRGNVDASIPGAGNVQGSVSFEPKQRAYNAQLQARGIRIEQLQAVRSKNMQISGVLDVQATGSGTLSNPGVQATVRIPELKVKDQTISGISLQTTVANHVANIALDSQVINTTVRGRGTISLTGNYDSNITLDTQAIPLAPLLAAYAPAQAAGITGQTELHATVRGPLKDKNLLEAHVVIPTLNVNYKNTVQIGEAAPIRADLVNGVLRIQRSQIRGTGTDLQFEGTVPMNSAAPVSLLLVGSVDLRFAQMLLPDITSGGQLKFNINSYGNRMDPDVHGEVQIVNASFTNGELPIGLENGNGLLTLTRDRLNITRFEGEVGGGRLSLSGGVAYKPSLGFHLAIAGRGIRMLYPQGVRQTIDTDLALTGNLQAATLRGQVKLDQLSFAPDFDLVNFMGQFGGETVAPPTGGFQDVLALDIAVQSTSGINLVSRTLSLQANANLRVAGTAAQPVVLGRVNVNSGDLIFSGNRYVLQGGTIDFVDPTRTQPVVNIAVNTKIQQYDIGLRFDGPADHLRTTYSSEPSLPPADIINLLAFGKTTESAAANPTPPGNAGAQSLIASQVSSQVTSRFERLAGISQLSIDPVLGGETQNPGARITIRQRVTGSLFLTFSSDVTSTQQQTIQVEYNLTPRVSVSTTRDQNGGFGFDTRIKKSW